MVWTPDISIPRKAVAGSVMVTVAVLMTLGVAGVLSGFGLFILFMIAGDTAGVISSSMVFAASISVFISCYIWLTA